MVHYIIICRSLTYAQRTAKVLERAGITAIVMRPPEDIAGEGCAYGVKLRQRNLAQALKLLKDAGLSHGKVYLLRPGGSEEVSG